MRITLAAVLAAAATAVLAQSPPTETHAVRFDEHTDNQFHVRTSRGNTPQWKFTLWLDESTAWNPTGYTARFFYSSNSLASYQSITNGFSITNCTVTSGYCLVTVAATSLATVVDSGYAALLLQSSTEAHSWARGKITVYDSPELDVPGATAPSMPLDWALRGPYSNTSSNGPYRFNATAYAGITTNADGSITIPAPTGSDTNALAQLGTHTNATGTNVHGLGSAAILDTGSVGWHSAVGTTVWAAKLNITNALWYDSGGTVVSFAPWARYLYDGIEGASLDWGSRIGYGAWTFTNMTVNGYTRTQWTNAYFQAGAAFGWGDHGTYGYHDLSLGTNAPSAWTNDQTAVVAAGTGFNVSTSAAGNVTTYTGSITESDPDWKAFQAAGGSISGIVDMVSNGITGVTQIAGAPGSNVTILAVTHPSGTQPGADINLQVGATAVGTRGTINFYFGDGSTMAVFGNTGKGFQLLQNAGAYISGIVTAKQFYGSATGLVDIATQPDMTQTVALAGSAVQPGDLGDLAALDNISISLVTNAPAGFYPSNTATVTWSPIATNATTGLVTWQATSAGAGDMVAATYDPANTASQVAFSNDIAASLALAESAVQNGDTNVTLHFASGTTIEAAINGNEPASLDQVLSLTDASSTFYFSPTPSAVGPTGQTNMVLKTSQTATNWSVTWTGSPTGGQYIFYFVGTSNMVSHIMRGNQATRLYPTYGGGGGSSLTLGLEGYIFDTATTTKYDYAEASAQFSPAKSATIGTHVEHLAVVPYATNIVDTTKVYMIGIKVINANSVTSVTIWGGSNNISTVQLPVPAALELGQRGATNITIDGAAAGTYDTGTRTLDLTNVVTKTSLSTNITTPLVIGGTATNSVLTLQGTSGTGFATTQAVQIAVGANGATKSVTALNNGNVGIGTTSPTEVLQVGSDGTSRTILLSNYRGSIGDYGRIDFGLGGNASSVLRSARIEGYRTDSPASADTDLRFSTYGGSLSEKMRITGAGNVGIGATTPAAKLHVNGGMAVEATTNTYTANTNRVFLYVTTGSNAQLRVLDGDGNVTDIGAINPANGHEETVTYNEWTGEGQTRDIDALVDAVTAIAARMPDARIDASKLRWATSHTRKDFTATHTAIRAESIAKRAAWQGNTNTVEVKGEQPAVYEIPAKPSILRRWEDKQILEPQPDVAEEIERGIPATRSLPVGAAAGGGGLAGAAAGAAAVYAALRKRRAA